MEKYKMNNLKSEKAENLAAVKTHTYNLVKNKIENIVSSSIFSFGICVLKLAKLKYRTSF